MHSYINCDGSVNTGVDINQSRCLKKPRQVFSTPCIDSCPATAGDEARHVSEKAPQWFFSGRKWISPGVWVRTVMILSWLEMSQSRCRSKPCANSRKRILILTWISRWKLIFILILMVLVLRRLVWVPRWEMHQISPGVWKALCWFVLDWLMSVRKWVNPGLSASFSWWVISGPNQLVHSSQSKVWFTSCRKNQFRCLCKPCVDSFRAGNEPVQAP